MPCIVAVANSPIFSPSHRVSPIFRAPSLSSPATSSSSSSPLSLHFHKQLSGGYGLEFKKEETVTLLKRQRPSSINIPALDFDSVVETPLDVDRLGEVEVEGDGYSVYCKRGKRGRVMEDRYAAVVGLHGDSKQAFFGVFDGHGGPKAAEFAAKHLNGNIMTATTSKCEEEIKEAVKEGYLTTDAEFMKEDVNGGTCCVTALIQKGNLVVSNAGDCRAVISRGGVALSLTVDHRPSREDERKRIECLGGYVDCRNGVWRIQGSLAVSRGIGDRHLKQWVIAEPESKILKIRPQFEFLILASDGLWDKVSNQEAADIVRHLCIGVDKPEPFFACKKLVDLSVTRGSTDDISVMVIQLDHFVT